MLKFISTKSTILFNETELRYEWKSYTDAVTGGTSEAKLTFNDDYLTFHGNITKTTNGCWASLRSNTVLQNLTAYQGVEIKLKSDGRPYAFEMEYNVAWQDPKLGYMIITPANEWTVVRIPLKSFKTVQLNTLTKTSVDPSVFKSINRFNFFVAGKIIGPFELHLEYIKFY